MDLADQPVGQREAPAQPRQAMLQCGNVVGHLDHVVKGHSGRLFEFKEQQVGERRLGSFNLRGEHGLLADVGIEEEGLVGQQRGHAVEAAEREDRRLELLLQRAGERNRRCGRKRGRQERAHLVAADRGDLVAAGFPSSHAGLP